MAGNRNLQSLSNLVKAISRLSQNSGEMPASYPGAMCCSMACAAFAWAAWINLIDFPRALNDVNKPKRLGTRQGRCKKLQTTWKQRYEANQNEIRVVAEHDALNTPDRRYPENVERNGLLSSYVERQQKYAHITCTHCNTLISWLPNMVRYFGAHL
jgi:hypothetical protein